VLKSSIEALSGSADPPEWLHFIPMRPVATVKPPERCGSQVQNTSSSLCSADQCSSSALTEEIS